MNNALLRRIFIDPDHEDLRVEMRAEIAGILTN